MIKIRFKGVYSLNELLEVAKILEIEETTDGVDFGLKNGDRLETINMGDYNDYYINFHKKDYTLYINVSTKEKARK